MGIVWSESAAAPSVLRVLLSSSETDAESRCREVFPSCTPGACDGVLALAARMTAFLAGDPVDIPTDLARFDACGAFQRRVLLAERTIPRGRFSSYALLAEAVGSPGACRAVGAALARNPFPLIVPCHRTLRGDGSPGGYQGGPGMKRRLLEMEGVRFDPAGRAAGTPWDFGGYAPGTGSAGG